MSVGQQTIEVDEATAELLRGEAAERGVSVSQLVADLIRPEAALAVEDEDIAELDRRWAEIKSGTPTAPHDDVVRWLETWGQPNFKPWHDH